MMSHGQPELTLMMHLVLSPAFLSLILLFVSLLWMLKDESDRTRVLLFFGLLINIIYGSVQQVLMGAMGALLPWKYDYVLYGLDTALGLSAPAIARAFTPWMLSLLSIAYALMVPAMIVLYISGAGREQRRDVAVAYFAEMAFGPLLYALLPACGPIYAFRATWPDVQTHPALQPVKLGGMPNAFPSLHFATALVLLVFARPGKWRIMAAMFVVATALATISTGEHYLIDLAAGILFACFAASAGRRNYRMASLFLGLTAISALLIRSDAHVFFAHPILLRGAVIVGCFLSALSLARLGSTSCANDEQQAPIAAAASAP
jgi:PAP2 superfamily